MSDFGDARQALSAAAQRSADLIESIDDMDLPLLESEWSIQEAAGHLIFALRGFSASASGAYEEWVPMAERLPATVMTTSQRIAAVNRIFVSGEPRRSPAEAAQAITEGAKAFLEVTASLSPDQPMATPWYGERQSLTIGEATCLLLGEEVIHGYDIARAAHRRWPIARSDAGLIMTAVGAMLPKLARPQALGQVQVTFQVHPGGKGGFVARCADGAIVVEPPHDQRVDCHIVTDPIAFLLLGYGRISLWRAVGRGKMFVWGRRPWMAFRFPSFIDHP